MEQGSRVKEGIKSQREKTVVREERRLRADGSSTVMG